MAIKKSQLYSSLWQACDKLRGGMDSSQYKNYVLVILFIKYVSDKYDPKNFPDNISPLITIPNDSSFTYMLSLKNNNEIGSLINDAIERFVDANVSDKDSLLHGIMEKIDFNDSKLLGDGKDKVKRLSELLSVFDNNLDFSKNRIEDDDLLGDAYEYLMRQFASEVKKNGGQFYTPSEVSQVMAKIIGINKNHLPKNTVYDPTCGSGSLLLKAVAESKNGKMSIYGQEIDVITTGLAKMNMVLHGATSAIISDGGHSTLSSPKHLATGKINTIKTFDFVIANPPFSLKSWQGGLSVAETKKTEFCDPYNRFKFGTPPEKNGDYAFLLHIISSMNSKGKGAVILPHGVLFRGNKEGEIREKIIKHGFIKGIIGLPANLFYGTGIPACIILLDKSEACHRKSIFMIDASKGFIKDGDKNRLQDRDIYKITDIYNNQIEIDGYSRIVPVSEIEKNEYNLNIPRYINSTKEDDIHDLNAHLHGGIPKNDIDELKIYWDEFPLIYKDIFKIKNNNYLELTLNSSEIKTKILNSVEYKKYRQGIIDKFNHWKDEQKDLFYNFSSKPKEIINLISDNLINHFANAKLIDKYDIYQCLMTYWHDTMQDDIYQIFEDGWLKAKNEILPDDIIINYDFEKEKQALEEFESQKNTINSKIEEFEEEQGENLDDIKNDKGKITKTSIDNRIKEIKNDKEYIDELKILQQYKSFLDELKVIDLSIKNATNELNKLVAKYRARLTEDNIKQLVVFNKWFNYLENAISNQIEKVIQKFVRRIKELDERYKTPLPTIEHDVEQSGQKVKQHLKAMGFDYDY